VTSWFDESPETYERARPCYPEPLWDELFLRLPTPARLVEIGPATGKATGALLSRGASVTACEPGANLAAYLRAKLPDERLHVCHGRFEDATLPHGAFDAVVAATSFHWLDPAVRMTKSHAILAPNGVLAIVDTNQVASAVDRGYFQASQSIYDRYFPRDSSPAPVVPGRDVVPHAFDELRDCDLFDECELFRYDWDQRYETASYLDLVRSYSNTARLEPLVREAFLGDLAAFIGREFDGYVVRPLVITLSCARRRR